LTRLERFMQRWKIKPARLALESGYSRQHLRKIRMGIMEPSRPCIAAIVGAASRLTNSVVGPEELFVLSEDPVWERQQAKLSRRAAAEQRRLRIEARALVVSLETARLPFGKWVAAIEAEHGTSLAVATALYERGRELTFENPRAAERVHRVAAALAGKLPPTAAALSVHGRALMGRGNALAHMGEYPDAFAAFDEAETLLTKSPHCIGDLAQAWYSRARTHFQQTAFEEASRWTRIARAVFEAIGDERLGALARLLEGTILYDTGCVVEAERLLRTTIEPLERLKDSASVAFAYLDIGRCNIDLGEVKTARVWLEKARATFFKHSMRSEVVRAEWCLAWLRALHEDFSSGLHQLHKARQNFEELEMPTDAALVGLDTVEVLLLKDVDGAAAKAAQVCRSIIDLFERRGEAGNARRAIANLREAVQRKSADQNDVREVKQFLRRWRNDPQAVFNPREQTDRR
jgi:tetratricopeptide (TPR) repeat protein